MHHRTAARFAFAVLLAAVAAMPAAAQVADGKVAVHYSRCDGNYDGWGLHTWQNPDKPLPGVSWGTPLQPAGKDDFGVFWTMDLAEYGDGVVNYIVHQGDRKEQGGRDMKFDGKSTRQIWVNNNDSKIYASLADAKKARELQPCK